ncbi:aldose 1-epimerase family protein [Streptomyces aureus]
MTGRQLTLRHGGHAADVVELGAALRSYTFEAREVVHGFGPDDLITGGHGQILAPWPNRVGAGRYRWRGEDQRLPLSEPDSGNAIHGLLRWNAWQVTGSDAAVAELETGLWPQPGYPFRLRVRARYALDDAGLEVTLTAWNEGDETAPYGVGQHPYLTVGTDAVDDATLTVPAGTWLRTDEKGLPVAEEPVTGTPYDFREPRAIGADRLDTPFGSLVRDADGRAVVRLAHPSDGHGVDLWLAEGTEYLQIYTGDTLAEPERRRAVAVEPMSCPPNAFADGVAVVALEPGDHHTLRWGITPW